MLAAASAPTTVSDIAVSPANSTAPSVSINSPLYSSAIAVFSAAIKRGSPGGRVLNRSCTFQVQMLLYIWSGLAM